MKAVWNNQIVAQSDQTVMVENNHYFPASSIKSKYFESSSTTTHCPWKGEASYYSIVVDGQRNDDAAWFYPEPKDAVKAIKDHVAFWRGVELIA